MEESMLILTVVSKLIAYNIAKYVSLPFAIFAKKMFIIF